MLRRTELEPMSTAAKTGIDDQARWARARAGPTDRDGLRTGLTLNAEPGLSAEPGFNTEAGLHAANRRAIAANAAECFAANKARISTSTGQFMRSSNCFSAVAA